MRISTTCRLVFAFLFSAFFVMPTFDVVIAAGGVDPNPAPVTTPPAKTTAPPAATTNAPAKDTTAKKHWWQKLEPGSKPADKKSSIDDPAFLKGYREAYATIYERNDYSAAIPQLEALGQPDRADVANLIGYSYRKLGNYQLASQWYERALKADPNHVRTWQYYGLWQIEQGNRDQAMYHLGKIEKIAGKNCPEYASLAQALTTGQTTY
ncbi:MAG: tetratricopeptide repeat protein [Afipia sp.]|nr:tetratricopeptide repeat protein [Afipia sp.]